MYDLIGDLHGHATELKDLLERMGYVQSSGCYRHPAARRAIFVGDFIDRGPHIREVLEVVRTMVEQGTALAVMGNHEFNAIALEAGYRENNEKNRSQYVATLAQLRVAERQRWIEWFRTLPLWLDLGALRIVHACWNTAALAHLAGTLRQYGGFTDNFLREASNAGSPTFGAIEVILKGPEIGLPPGVEVRDADGHVRNKSRTRWFDHADGQTWRNYLLSPGAAETPDTLVVGVPTGGIEPYSADAPPVFFGHYWFRGERPALVKSNVACLDYSVARDGYLCAYRWSGEQQLDPVNFVGPVVVDDGSS
jgi:hypothetical protein